MPQVAATNRPAGVVENMTGFVCPKCALCTNIFGKGGGQIMADDFKVPFLGEVPIDPQFIVLLETGKRPVYPQGTVIQGQDMSGSDNKVQDAGDQNGRYAHLLVDKYQSCSLEPIFRKITGNLIAAIQ